MPYLTSLSDKMVEKGYLERNQSKEDRRIITIKLTAKGKKAFNKLEVKPMYGML